jgi:hypothetical protein
LEIAVKWFQLSPPCVSVRCVGAMLIYVSCSCIHIGTWIYYFFCCCSLSVIVSWLFVNSVSPSCGTVSQDLFKGARVFYASDRCATLLLAINKLHGT